MSNFYAFLHQPNGCDYTIGCGISFQRLNATTREAALTELREMVLQCSGEYALDDAKLFEVASAETMPIEQWYREHDEAERQVRDADRDRREREDYERLRQKYG